MFLKKVIRDLGFSVFLGIMVAAVNWGEEIRSSALIAGIVAGSVLILLVLFEIWSARDAASDQNYFD